MCSQYKILPNVGFFFFDQIGNRFDLHYIYYINICEYGCFYPNNGTRRRVDVGEKK